MLRVDVLHMAITGCAVGIGLALMLHYAKAGALVTILGPRKVAADHLAAEFSAAGHSACTFIDCGDAAVVARGEVSVILRASTRLFCVHAARSLARSSSPSSRWKEDQYD